MRLTILILAILLSFGTVVAQETVDKNEGVELMLKVWQDTEKDYQKFIKKQARIRKKFDKYFDSTDTDQLESLKSAYYRKIESDKENIKDMLETKQDENSVLFEESFRTLHERFSHQIRSHEYLQPLLWEKSEFKNTAEYLSEKYNDQIVPLHYKISKAYLKLRYKEREVSLKYRKEPAMTEKQRKSIKESKRKKPRSKGNLLQNTKFLITASS